MHECSNVNLNATQAISTYTNRNVFFFCVDYKFKILCVIYQNLISINKLHSIKHTTKRGDLS